MKCGIVSNEEWKMGGRGIGWGICPDPDLVHGRAYDFTERRNKMR